MKVMNFGEVPVGSLVVADRTAACETPHTALGIKAEFGRGTAQNMISMFWLGTDLGPPCFDVSFQSDMCFLSNSCRITALNLSGRFFESADEAIAARKLGLFVSDVPFFLGQYADQRGNVAEHCLCTPSGVVKKIARGGPSLFQVESWEVHPSPEAHFGWHDSLASSFVPFS